MLLLLSQQLPTLPSVLLQALVTTGPEVHEPENKGHVIEAVGPAWGPLLEILRSAPDEIFKLSSRQFEELIAASYKKSGFDKVILTPRSGDSGRDVIAEKSGWFSVRIVDQAKAFKPTHLVTADDVRALGHVLAADRAASKGVVTTTSTFAPRIGEDPFIAPFLPTRIELVDGKDLLKRLDSLRQDG